LPAPAFNPLRAIPVGDRERLEVDITAIRAGRTWRPAAGRSTLLVDGHLLGVDAGDRLQVFAALRRPMPAHNPGEFDFADHARADGQLSVLRANYPDCVTVLARGAAWSPRRWLGRLRARGDELLASRLTVSRHPLASAILLGERNLLSAERTESFLTTGSIHLLVVSGLHVAILASALFFGMRMGLLPRRMSLLAIGALVVLFALATGGRPPVVRAVVLVLIVIAAKLSGRRAWSFNALAAAAIVVLVMNPADLFRVGVQLSFLAVAALMWIAGFLPRPSTDPLDRLIAASRTWPNRAARWCGRYYWQLTLASAVVWLVCLPLVMARFHLFTPIAVVVGPLLWAPMAVALLAGFGVLVFGWILPPVGEALSHLCDLCCGLLQRGVDWAAGVERGHSWVAGPETWWLAGFYAGLAMLLAFPRIRPPVRWRLGLLAAWILLGLAPVFMTSDDERLRCTFIAVGHGSSVLVELPHGQTVLYDAGGLASPHAAARSIAATLWSRGQTHVDAVVLSHADVDHYNALPELLDRFTVGAIFVSPVMFEQESAALAELQAALAQKDIPVREVYAGDSLATQSATRIEVLHPPRTGVLGSDNANSIVLLIEHRGRKILLPGDLESPGIDDVMAERPLDCDLLMAPHHGSSRSDPPGFAAWSTPDWLVISGGDEADAAQVAAAYTNVGAQVRHTARHGAIEATIAAEGIEVTTFRAGGGEN
jgi:competence protein ComEC